jgi:hypothetical protein
LQCRRRPRPSGTAGNLDDALEGNAGNDTLWGGDGDDSMNGGSDDDKLCDASGYNTCATDGGDGGNGDDKLWYNESENPGVPCPSILLDSSSTAGGGGDYCGDNNDYTTGELPDFCENYLTVVPTLCVGAN